MSQITAVSAPYVNAIFQVAGPVPEGYFPEFSIKVEEAPEWFVLTHPAPGARFFQVSGSFASVRLLRAAFEDLLEATAAAQVEPADLFC